MACATDIKYTKPEIIHDNMYITLMLGFSWIWHGKMLAHPIYWRQACAGQVSSTQFWKVCVQVKKLAIDKSMCELTEFSQHTPGFKSLAS
jgi:hypothetical protein